ncbi:hypothetical protein DFH29DRAFT_970615 [Suillus ampliporus]|nr:hypothetical protein DFH29DRAFT_970615 [Suillus ampliporus]
MRKQFTIFIIFSQLATRILCTCYMHFGSCTILGERVMAMPLDQPLRRLLDQGVLHLCHGNTHMQPHFCSIILWRIELSLMIHSRSNSSTGIICNPVSCMPRGCVILYAGFFCG